jgi:hypothetical protein
MPLTSELGVVPTIQLPHAAFTARVGFTTSQVDKSIDKGKAWQLHRRTLLEPASPSQIRAHERHLRKAGPLRALSAYARDKNVLKLVSKGTMQLHRPHSAGADRHAVQQQQRQQW